MNSWFDDVRTCAWVAWSGPPCSTQLIFGFPPVPRPHFYSVTVTIILMLLMCPNVRGEFKNFKLPAWKWYEAIVLDIKPKSLCHCSHTGHTIQNVLRGSNRRQILMDGASNKIYQALCLPTDIKHSSWAPERHVLTLWTQLAQALANVCAFAASVHMLCSLTFYVVAWNCKWSAYLL